MSVQIRDIIAIMEKIAPTSFAEDWDNVGLLVGDGNGEVNRILVTLDVTSSIVKEAIEREVDMIISHHPIIFSPLKSMGQNLEDRNILYPLIQKDIAVYCAHTNLDKAKGGVDDTLADILGLQNMEILIGEEGERYFKLVVFVPRGYEEQVMNVLSNKGAGFIGNYSHCTFQAKGMGTFKPLEGTNPFIGSQGVVEKVEEIRLETVVPESIVYDVVDGMIDVHPYEEVAYDLYPLATPTGEIGLGRVGKIDRIMTVEEFARRVKEVLKLENVRIIGDRGKMIETVVSCAGAGGDFVRQAVDAGGDVFVTGEIKYHQALLALELGLPIIELGHYETERPAMEVLINHLQKKFNALQYKVEVLSSSTQHELVVNI